jgi:hypothetical protein
MASIDNNTLILLIIVTLALIAIAVFVVSQRRTSVKVQGLLGTSLASNASHEPAQRPPAVALSDATSRRGRLIAKDEAARGVEINGIGFERLMMASSTSGEPDPKACPPVAPGAWPLRPRLWKKTAAPIAS